MIVETKNEQKIYEQNTLKDSVEKYPKKLDDSSHSVLVFDYKNRAEGIHAPTISALGSYQGWQEIEVTVDSGACDTVMPISLCSDIPRHESEQQRSGLEYEVANGACIRNEGERRCLMMTKYANGP